MYNNSTNPKKSPWIFNFWDVSLHILDQHNYPVVQYNEQFGLLKSLLSSDSDYFSHAIFIFVTGFGKTGLIAGLVKIDFFPEKASTKFKYCLRKI